MCSDRCFLLPLEKAIEQPAPKHIIFVLPNNELGYAYQKQFLKQGALKFAFYDCLKTVLNLVSDTHVSILHAEGFDFTIIKENLEKNPERRIAILGRGGFFPILQQQIEALKSVEKSSSSEEQKKVGPKKVEQKSKFIFPVSSK